jgi:hypothetical protein
VRGDGGGQAAPVLRRDVAQPLDRRSQRASRGFVDADANGTIPEHRPDGLLVIAAGRALIVQEAFNRLPLAGRKRGVFALDHRYEPVNRGQCADARRGGEHGHERASCA